MRTLEHIGRDITAQKAVIKQQERKLDNLYVEYTKAYEAIPKPREVTQ